MTAGGGEGGRLRSRKLQASTLTAGQLERLAVIVVGYLGNKLDGIVNGSVLAYEVDRRVQVDVEGECATALPVMTSVVGELIELLAAELNAQLTLAQLPLCGTTLIIAPNSPPTLPPSPPTSPPTSPPWPSPVMPGFMILEHHVYYNATIAGAVDSFNSTDYQRRLSAFLSIPLEDITLQVHAGSVIVVARISSQSAAAAADIVRALAGLTPISNATAALGVQVEFVAPVTTVFSLVPVPSPPQPPTPPSSTPPALNAQAANVTMSNSGSAQLLVVVLVTVFAAAGMVVIFHLCSGGRKRRSKRVQPNTELDLKPTRVRIAPPEADTAQGASTTVDKLGPSVNSAHYERAMALVQLGLPPLAAERLAEQGITGETFALLPLVDILKAAAPLESLQISVLEVVHASCSSRLAAQVGQAVTASTVASGSGSSSPCVGANVAYEVASSVPSPTSLIAPSQDGVIADGRCGEWERDAMKDPSAVCAGASPMRSLGCFQHGLHQDDGNGTPASAHDEDLAALAPAMQCLQWGFSVGQEEPFGAASAPPATDPDPPALHSSSALWKACSYRGASKQNHPHGQALVGRRVRVYWEDDHVFFEGTVSAYDSATQKHTIVYDDGDQQNEPLQAGDVCVWELYRTDDDAPDPAADPEPAEESSTPEPEDVGMQCVSAPAPEEAFTALFTAQAQLAEGEVDTQAAPDPAILESAAPEPDYLAMEFAAPAPEEAFTALFTAQAQLAEGEVDTQAAPDPAILESAAPEPDYLAMEFAAPAPEEAFTALFTAQAQSADHSAGTQVAAHGISPWEGSEHSERGDSSAPTAAPTSAPTTNRSLSPRLTRKQITNKIKSATIAERAIKRSMETTSIPKVAPKPPTLTREEMRRRVSERTAAAEIAHRERSKAVLARSSQGVQAAVRVSTLSTAGPASGRPAATRVSPFAPPPRMKRTQERLRLAFRPT